MGHLNILRLNMFLVSINISIFFLQFLVPMKFSITTFGGKLIIRGRERPEEIIVPREQ